MKIDKDFFEEKKPEQQKGEEVVRKATIEEYFNEGEYTLWQEKPDSREYAMRSLEVDEDECYTVVSENGGIVSERTFSFAPGILLIVCGLVLLGLCISQISISPDSSAILLGVGIGVFAAFSIPLIVSIIKFEKRRAKIKYDIYCITNQRILMLNSKGGFAIDDSIPLESLISTEIADQSPKGRLGNIKIVFKKGKSKHYITFWCVKKPEFINSKIQELIDLYKN